MRVCMKCGKGKWQGAKKGGKFICAECLAPKPVAEKAEVVEELEKVEDIVDEEMEDIE